MNRSSEGPARSLLNSFTVATTSPPPGSTQDAYNADQTLQATSQINEDGDADNSNSIGYSGSRGGSRGATPPLRLQPALETEVEDEGGPQPSVTAPRPAPAPARSADQSSIDALAATAHPAPPGLVSAGLHVSWKPTMGYADASTARGASLTWRSTRAETPSRASSWKQLHSFRPLTEGGAPRRQTSEVGGLTPKIRYCSSSCTSAPRTSAASPSTSSSVGQHSPGQQQWPVGRTTYATSPRVLFEDTSGRGSSSWGANRVGCGATGETAEDNSVLSSSDWLHRHEPVVPVIAPMPTLPAWPQSSIRRPFEAAWRTGRGAEELTALRPPPPFVQARLGTSEEGAGSTSLATGSAAMETRSAAASAPLSSAAPLSSWRVPAQNGRGNISGRDTPRVPIAEARAPPPSQATPPPAVAPAAEAAYLFPEDGGLGDAGADAVPAEPLFYSNTVEPLAQDHLTLRSLTEEYNQFSTEGTVGWVGLQVHLRRHTQSTQITALDLTCYRMQREQWTWFTLEILPQLQLLEVLRLVQMGLTDDEVAELVRGSCGWSTHADIHPRSSSAKRAPLRPGSSFPHGVAAPPSTATAATVSATVTSAAAAAQAAPTTRAASLPFLRVLDLSGNAISQRSCNHLGKMLLWTADSLEEVRLLGNPLKDYGMQTLGIYLSKLNVETLRDNPDLFPATLRHQFRLAQEQGCIAAATTAGRKTHQKPDEDALEGGVAEAADKAGLAGSANALAELPIGPVYLDLRDCRASARGLSDILAAASRAHRLRVIVLSHNVPGATALLPLPSTVYQEALDVVSAGAAATVTTTATATAAYTAEDGSRRSQSRSAQTYRLGPAPRRLRLAKAPLISSGALMRRQRGAFSEVQGFATSCALSTLVFHCVPLSQTCSPGGCRELLLNIFFSCPQLDLVDLSDTFEWSLVPPEEQQRLVVEAGRRDAIEQRLRGPKAQRGLQMYREDQGEVEFVLDTATVGGQTRLGDIFGELMAHASHNAVVRQRVVPPAFAHIRELDLSNAGLTDGGVRGLCVSVRRGRARTGMLASLAVLNLSDNLLTVRGCLRVISSFLLEDVEGEGEEVMRQEGKTTAAKTAGLRHTKSTTADGGQHAAERPLIAIAPMTALALQRNAGVEGEEDDGSGVPDRISGYIAEGNSEKVDVSPGRRWGGFGGEEGRAQVLSTREGNAYLSEVCTAAEAAVLRRATLRSAARGLAGCGGAGGEVPPLTVYFSVPPVHALGSRGGGVGTDNAPHRRSSDLDRGGGAGANGSSVYYAGCDERGDIFCTCPCSRFFVPSVEPDCLVSVSATRPAAAQANATTANAGNPYAAVDASSSALALNPQFSLQAGAQRSLLSTLCVPRTPAKVPPRSQLPGRPGAGLTTTSDVHLPPRPNTVLANTTNSPTTVLDDVTGLVNSTPLYPSASSVGDTLTTSLSFPPPSSMVLASSDAAAAAAAAATATAAAHWAETNQAAHQQQEQLTPAAQQAALHGPRSSRNATLASTTGASLGALFMDKTEPQKESATDDAAAASNDGGSREPRESAATTSAERSGATVKSGKGGEDGDGGGERDSQNSLAARSSKRRARARFCRTFILSYDHPAGHLLCRVLSVLARPAPDAFGECARAALAEDLLSALQRACARASASPDGDDSNNEDVAGKVSPRVVVVVESVKYLPPDLAATDSVAEQHWMRFEITTNERKARMAQRLQEVLNVSWAAQCACFAHLLQWLRTHVTAEGDADASAAAKARGMGTVAATAEWDPVQVIERAARASPYVRAKLDALYAGSAVAAVHAHHLDAANNFFTAVGGHGGDEEKAEASQRMSLAQLHPVLWTEMGLAASAAATAEGGVDLSETHDIVAASQGKFLSPLSLAGGDSKRSEEAGEDMYSAISESQDTSRKAEPLEGKKRQASQKVASPLSMSQRSSPPQHVPVVDLYAPTEDAKETEGEEEHGQDMTSGKEDPKQPNSLKKTANEADSTNNDDEDDAAAAAATARPPIKSPRPAAAAMTTSSPVAAHYDDADEALAISASLAPGYSQAASTTTAAPAPAKERPAEDRPSRTLRTKIFRNLDELSDSEDDNDERGTKSVETPEKQTRGRSDRSREAELPSSSPPLPASLPKSEKREQKDQDPMQVQPSAPIDSRLVVQTPPDNKSSAEQDDDAAVLTDQLMGPLSPTDAPLSRPSVSTTAPAVAERQGMSRESTECGAVDTVAAAVTQTREGSLRGEQGDNQQPAWINAPSSGNTPESRGKDSTQSDSPSSPGSRQRAPSTKEATTASPSEAQKEEKGKVGEVEEDDVAVTPPVRVRRRSSELEGRIKTFTLSYTHQEGTAVCRAWRLLHSTLGSEGNVAAEACSPTSPMSAALAQEARDCLCDDFLALLQPPDDDRKHAVLSVTLHGDSGVATAMLQVQVQTNERRATLANRLQDSNHGVRRGGSGGGRVGLVPLTVDQVDRFYFPRLTRLLRRHQFVADTVAQLDRFLEARPAVQSRLMKSYGSVGALVHYYHGSAAALEHELGISSWRELTGGAAPALAAQSVASAAEQHTAFVTRLQVESSSPKFPDDRVMPQRDTSVRDDDDNSKSNNGRSGGNGKGRSGDDASRKEVDRGAPSRLAIAPPEMKRVSSNSSLKLNPVTSAAQQLQGRPPPHPHRPPTPPNPITHTDSISFDEVTEELTSEAGPIVVLRGSTPSPSTLSTCNPQYYPAGYRDSGGAMSHLSHSPEHERERHGDTGSDPGGLSPMTSASASPSVARLPDAPSSPPPPHTQQTVEGRPAVSSIKGNSSSSKEKELQRAEAETVAATGVSCTRTLPSSQVPPRDLRGNAETPEPPRTPSPPPPPQPPQAPPPQRDHRGQDITTASNANLSRQASGSSAAPAPDRGKSEYERVLEGKYKRLMRVAYDGVARGSVPLEPQHQQKMVIGRGKWGSQKVELSLEWEILFVLTFEKSRAIGRSSRRAQMIVHPVGFGFECMSGDEVSHQVNETSSLHSSTVNAMTAEGSGVHHPPPGTTTSQISRGSRAKKESSKSAASHLIIMIQRPFSPNEVGSSSSEIEKTLMANALLTVSSPSSLSKAARLLGGSDDASNTSRGSAGTNQVAQDVVYQLCQRSLLLDIEMKNSKHVQEALRLLKHSIRRATQAVKKSMSNAHLRPPPSQ